MKKLFQAVAVTVLALVVLAIGSGPFWFKVLAARMQANLAAPRLVRLDRGSVGGGDLVYRTLEGQPQHLSDAVRRGPGAKGQVVVLELWGTWCVQCVAQMPTVERLYDHYRNDPEVRFLIVSRMDSAAAVRSYARRNGLDLPFYLTSDEEIPESMQLHQFPATFVYAKDGRLVAEHTGAADWSDGSVIEFLDRLKRQ